MSFFFEIKYNTIECPNGCILFNDKRNFSYWESKNVTNDERYIVDYLNTHSEALENKNIFSSGIDIEEVASFEHVADYRTDKFYQENFSIDEILSAVDDIQNKTKKNKLSSNKELTEKDYSAVPKNTLRLIEEAENK